MTRFLHLAVAITAAITVPFAIMAGAWWIGALCVAVAAWEFDTYIFHVWED